MKRRKKDQELTFLFISLGIVAASWFGVAQPVNKKIQELTTLRTELQTEYDERMKMIEKKDGYLKDIAVYNDAYSMMMEHYPEGVTPAEQIMFVAGLEEQFGMQVVSLSYTDEEPLYSFQSVENGNEKPYVLTSASIQIPVTLYYEEWKDFLSYIFASHNKSTVPEITATYVEATGKVAGTMVITQYAVKGEGREAEESQLMVPLGSENLFTSGTRLVYSGSMAEQIEAIKKSHACYVMLYPPASDVKAKVIAGSGEKEKVISESNEEERLLIVAQERDGACSLTYTLGEDRPRVLYNIEGETLDIYVLSSPRTGERDLSGVRVQIDNHTSKQMRIAVAGDDSIRPRFVVESQSENVNIIR